MMKKYEIWSEGYCITGGNGEAQFVGEAQGSNFKNAVLNWYEEHPDENFDSATLTYWGCKLFSSEKDARKSFG